MPASYAHYRFGKRLLSQLPPDVRQTVQRFRRMYDIGLQGPDIFFYYNPFLNTPVGGLGKAFHRQTGQEFFSVACSAATSEAAKAYLYGLLGHYCLDSVCHPFVNRLVKIEEARHVQLESELERFLLVQDGQRSPETFDMSKFLKITRGECMTVAEFYPSVTGAQVSRSVICMAFLLKFLARPNKARLVKLLQKRNPTLCDYMIPAEETEALLPYVRELYDLYEQALEQYPGLLSQLQACLQKENPLGEDFAAIFG